MGIVSALVSFQTLLPVKAPLRVARDGMDRSHLHTGLDVFVRQRKLSSSPHHSLEEEKNERKKKEAANFLVTHVYASSHLPARTTLTSTPASALGKMRFGALPSVPSRTPKRTLDVPSKGRVSVSGGTGFRGGAFHKAGALWSRSSERGDPAEGCWN